MKKVILLFAALALAGHAGHAQRTLPPALKSYADTYAEVFRSLGFLPDTRTARPSGTDVNRGLVPLTLDSILTFDTYPDSMPFFREAFSYPEAHVERNVQSYYEAGTWTPSGRNTQYEDELGRITEFLSESYDIPSGEFVPNLRTLIYPRGDSPFDIDSLVVLTWAPDIEEYETTLFSRYYYDILERVEEVVTTINFFGFIFTQIDYYNYDGEGRLVLIDSYAMDELFTIPLSREELTYDGDLLVSDVILISDDMGGYIPDERTDYDYTDEGLPDTVVTYLYDDFILDWFEFLFQDYDYDVSGKLIAETSVDSDESGPVSRSRVEYVYLDEDNLARYSDFDWDEDGQAWELVDRAYYYYAELTSVAGPRTPVMDLELWPNPTTGQVRLEPGDRAAKVWVYSPGGDLVDHKVLDAGTRELDLGRLPAGIYQVRVLSGDRIHVGRVVVQ